MNLVAQDQDLGSLPGLLTPRQPEPGGRPRGQQKVEPQAHDRVVITAGRVRRQLCWSGPRTRFSARTAAAGRRRP